MAKLPEPVIDHATRYAGRARFPLAVLVMLGLCGGLLSCYQSGSEDPPPAAPGIADGDIPPAGIAANGRIFYFQNCSVCHAAGGDDGTRAFGAIDLANQGSRISADMSHFDETYNLMARFTALDQARVDDLKRYLAGL